MGKKERNVKGGRAKRWEGTISAGHSPHQFFIAGLNGVVECLSSRHIRVRKIWVDEAKLPKEDRLLALLGEHNKRVETCPKGEVSYGQLNQGVALLAEPPTWPNLDDLLDQLNADGTTPLIVFLDQVEDPMNLGQIMRTCECAGVHALVIPKHRSAGLTQVSAQISQGAFAWLPVIEVVNFQQSFELLKSRGFWIAGCEAGPETKPWSAWDFTGPSAVVLGSEGRGLRNLTRKLVDGLIHLPQFGRINSLNVGAATAAIVFEAVRQRAQKP